MTSDTIRGHEDSISKGEGQRCVIQSKIDWKSRDTNIINKKVLPLV